METFLKIITIIFCFGLGGGLVIDTIRHWKYRQMTHKIASILIGLVIFALGIMAIIVTSKTL